MPTQAASRSTSKTPKLDFVDLSKSWHAEKSPAIGRGEEHYPADYVTFAWTRGYSQGKAEGKEEALKEFIESRWAELQTKAAQLATLRDRLYAALRTGSYMPIKTFLRIEPEGTFDLLFLVRHEDFVSENFRSMYAIARELRLGATTEEFQVNIGFISDSPNLDQKLILEDGYCYTHTIETKTKAPR